MLVISITLLAWLSLFFSFVPAYSAVFNISSGDVAGLISAINAANSNGEENTIYLAPGVYSLTAVNNSTNGPNGLPSIASRLTIQGLGAETTVIERNANAPPFRILHVGASASLTLRAVAVRRGLTPSGSGFEGGGLWTHGGLVTIVDSLIFDNTASDGGGIFSIDGTVTINNSVIFQNTARFGGGLSILTATDAVNIANSTISGNTATGGGGGGMILFESTVNITNTTVSRNTALSNAGIENLDGTVNITNTSISNNIARAGGGQGGGIGNSVIFSGRGMTITNSTIADNSATFGGGIHNDVGAVSLRSTILARNTADGFGPECFSNTIISLISLGHNLIGDPADCSITLQANDLTGDAGLGNFLDDGAPGHGRFPLLPVSRAIDGGNDSACPSTDQLDTPRNGPCDIGAVEFYPVVNDLVALGNLTTSFDPAPPPGGSAGTFRITAHFTNTSTQAILHPFVEVVELTGGNLLLNANGDPGGVGARLTLPNSANTPIEPGASSTFEFLIGLQQQQPFTFFVNMLGEPRTSNLPVTMTTKTPR
jgi:hypothetical protein